MTIEMLYWSDFQNNAHLYLHKQVPLYVNDKSLI